METVSSRASQRLVVNRQAHDRPSVVDADEHDAARPDAVAHVPGEELPKVVYRLVDAEQYRGRAVLVVGGGGREHALVWKLAQSPRVAEVLVALDIPEVSGILRIWLMEEI